MGKIPLEKEMATHSSILAWRISYREEAGGLQSMESQSQTQAGGSGSKRGTVGSGLQEVFHVHSPRAKEEGCGAVAAH